MNAQWIHKIYQQGSSNVVVLPPALLGAVGMARGDAVTLSTITGQEIVIRPVTRYIESLPPDVRDKGIIKK